MTNYDFKPLNDKEFESLCSDTLGVHLKVRFERFKPGKDSGIDGRFFTGDGKEVILQCKHWISTPFKQLIRTLKNTEKPKLEKLIPSRYLLAVSTPLSRADKKSILLALAPHIKSESDIFGQEDLNDILSKHKEIELRHYKLWLHSTAVISNILSYAIHGRSEFSLEEIRRTNAKYVVTSNHVAAQKILDKLGVVIITGEPGVGKTTLADQLCLEHIANGFGYLKISDEIREAEQAFDPETKQVIYFDDFLGRNYLEALKGHEGNTITHFIKRVASNRNKRLILTSRSTILNQGKLLIDSFEHNNVQRNEHELKIASLSEIDKAHILYNHIWHSGLDSDYIDQLYFNKRYRAIIKHRNFNPRLINYITDTSRLENCFPEHYWTFVENSLENPSQIWENAFIAQQDDFARALIILVVINGKAISEKDLSNAYHRYISLPENRNLHGRREFQANIRTLTGSFLNRSILQPTQVLINLFNPSIGDYVLGRYTSDHQLILQAMLSLRTLNSLNTLKSLIHNGSLSKNDGVKISESLLIFSLENKVYKNEIDYVYSLISIYKELPYDLIRMEFVLVEILKFIQEEVASHSTDYSLQVIEWAIHKNLTTPAKALNFAKINADIICSDQDIQAMTSLLSSIPETTEGLSELWDDIEHRVTEMFAENPADFIDLKNAFSSLSYGDHYSAKYEVKKLIESKLEYLGINSSYENSQMILDNCDIESELDRFFRESYYDNDEHQYHSPTLFSSKIDEVDDLFDRG